MERFTNNGNSTLNGAINNSVTALAVASASTFPTAGDFRIRIDDEIMLVTAVSGANFTVSRGAEGTAAASHSDSAYVRHVLTAGALSLGWTTITKASDESVSSSTVLQADDHLLFTTVAGMLYEIELDIIYASPAGGTSPDIKFVFGEDATDRGLLQALTWSPTADVRTISAIGVQNTTTLGSNTQTYKRVIRLRGWCIGNGGSLLLQWAQNSSSVNATIVYAGSTLRYLPRLAT